MKKAEKPPVPKKVAKAEAAIVKPSSKRRWLKVVFISSVLVIIVLAGGLTAYAFYVSKRILPHTQVAGVEVGGLTKEAALKKVQDKKAEFVKSDISFSYQDKKWSIPGNELGALFTELPAIDNAYNEGKNGSASSQVKAFLKSLVSRRSWDLDTLPLDKDAQEILTKQVLADIETQPAETSLNLEPGHVTVVPGKSGQKVNFSDVEAALYTSFKSGGSVTLELKEFQPEITAQEAETARVDADRILSAPWKLQAGNQSLSFEPQEVKSWLGTEVARDEFGEATALKLTIKDSAVKDKIVAFAKNTDAKPTNATLKQVNGVVQIDVPDKDGLVIAVDSTASRILAAWNNSTIVDRNVAADTQIAKADLRADTLESLGIKEVIGTGTTDFSGSPVNRTFNIHKGSDMLKGQLVKDGDTFSTIGTLGPIEVANGWRSELVIKGNRTTPEAGGGLCQVSTTLFRAVLNAGLPVTERANHSYRVAYYERGVGPGLDATIYDPKPDFQFKNDTGRALYVQSYVVGTKITFEIFGTKDGRVSDVPKPTIIEEIPVGAPIYSDTDTLFKGETKQIETPHNGAKTTVTYTVTRDGKEINKQTFNSYYVPWPAQYLVGTKDR